MTDLISEVKEGIETYKKLKKAYEEEMKRNEQNADIQHSLTLVYAPPLNKSARETFEKMLEMDVITSLETAERQREEAVKALEWYGDPENHEHPETGDYEVKNPPVWDDEGDLARTTLKRIKGENG